MFQYLIYIENLNFIDSITKSWNIKHAIAWLNLYIVPDMISTK